MCPMVRGTAGQVRSANTRSGCRPNQAGSTSRRLLRVVTTTLPLTAASVRREPSGWRASAAGQDPWWLLYETAARATRSSPSTSPTLTCPAVGRWSDALAAPIVKSLLGKAVVADDHPLTTGGLGLLGTRPSEDAMDGCDALLMVGTNYPYTAFLPEKARVVQIEADPTRAGARIATEVPLVGDSADTLRALLPLLERKTDRGFLEDAQQAMGKWRDDMAALESPERDPIQPQYLARVVDRHAAADAILCSDSGTIATWAARHFDIRGDRQFYLSGNLATMAPGLPYALAAQWAHPGRQCIAFVGDGGFAMLTAELLTAARYQLPVKVVICNNGVLGQILWEQMALGPAVWLSSGRHCEAARAHRRPRTRGHRRAHTHRLQRTPRTVRRHRAHPARSARAAAARRDGQHRSRRVRRHPYRPADGSGRPPRRPASRTGPVRRRARRAHQGRLRRHGRRRPAGG